MSQEKRALPEDDGGPFLTPRSAAAFLRCSPSTIQKWRQKGLLAKKRAWTREELLDAARNNAEREPAASGRRGLKLDLPKPRAGADGATPPATPAPKPRGFLEQLGSAFDFDDGA